MGKRNMTHSFKYIRPPCVPGTVPGPGDPAVERGLKTYSAFRKLTFQGRETDNKLNTKVKYTEC